MSTRSPVLIPLLATIVGIALFSAMDAVMKSASIAIGAYSALILRCGIGVALVFPIWRMTGGTWPKQSVLRIHLRRGVVVAFMALTFFFSLVRLPLAEAIALSFIAPLIALYLAAILLGEVIERKAIIAAVLGLAGVVVIVSSKVTSESLSNDAIIGLIGIGISAVLYAWNLILQRQQALVSQPAEVATFQNGIVTLCMLPAAPFILVWPDQAIWGELLIGALLSTSAAMVLSWAYARAEAQVLVPIEYTGFLWAMLFGWWMFGEVVTTGMVAGAALIVVGCWIATRKSPVHTEQASV